MKIIETNIHDVKLIEPDIFGDERGFFMEVYRDNLYTELLGEHHFVQDNHSKSNKGVLRGIHFQKPNAQGKLVRVAAGEVLDVVVDIRPNSPTCGNVVMEELDSIKHRKLWVPAGVAHGFLTLEDDTEFLYKCTDYYHPEHEYTLKWNDKTLNINWPNIGLDYIVSEKDRNGLSWEEIMKVQSQ